MDTPLEVQSVKDEQEDFPNQFSPKTKPHSPKDSKTVLVVQLQIEEIPKNKAENKPQKNEAEIQRGESVVIEQVQRLSSPFFFSKFLVKFPWIPVAFTYSLAILCLILIVVYDMYKITDSTIRELLVYDDEIVEKFDAVYRAQEKVEKSFTTNTALQMQICDKIITFIVFKTGEDSLYTPKNIAQIQDLIDKILALDKIPKFCYATSSTDNTCNPNYFVLSIFPALQGLDQSSIDYLLQNTFLSDESYNSFFGKDFTEDHPYSNLGRVILQFALPIEIGGIRYRDQTDRVMDQLYEIKGLLNDILDIVRDSDIDGVEVYDYSFMLYIFKLLDEINNGTLWAIGSFLFVTAYVAFHTRSLFLGIFGMVQVCSALPISLTIYRQIFGITYFGGFNALVIFILLGIAADNFFIFTDCFTQSKCHPEIKDDLQKRIAYTVRRSVPAITATSSTTAVAFLGNGLSSIMPLSAIGFYAFLILIINYLMTIINYPSLLYIYDKIISPKFTCFSFCKRSILNKCKQKYNSPPLNSERSESPSQQNSPSKILPMPEQPSSSIQIERRKYGKTELFFEKYWNTIIYKGRFVILIVLLGWAGYSISRIFKIQGLSKPEEYFIEDFDLSISRNSVRTEFKQGPNDVGIEVKFVWGVLGIDREGVNHWDVYDIGEPIWDSNFDMSSELAQAHLKTICEEVSAKTEWLRDSQSVKCFMTPLLSYANSLGKLNGDGYIPQAEFNDILLAFMQTEAGLECKRTYQIGVDSSNNIKYVELQFMSTKIPLSPRNELLPEHERWNDLLSQYNKVAPVGMKKAIMTGMDGFCFMVTEKALFDSAVQGMILAISFAFVVLLLSTLNWIITIYSIFSITLIIVCVLAVISFWNWEYGMSESLSSVMVIGFSVDYVVHLGNHYNFSGFNDRYNRMKDSLKEIGISIFGGSLTTIGAAVFLLFPKLLIFRKIGNMIIASICFALVFSLIFFSALNHTIGPQGGRGDLKKVISKIKEALSKKCKPKHEN